LALNYLARTAFNAQFGEYVVERANPGEAALKQIETDKGREQQEILAHEYRAAFHAQRQGKHDKKTCNDSNNAFCVHDLKLLKLS
jgi:hypothetical protein